VNARPVGLDPVAVAQPGLVPHRPDDDVVIAMRLAAATANRQRNDVVGAVDESLAERRTLADALAGDGDDLVADLHVAAGRRER